MGEIKRHRKGRLFPPDEFQNPYLHPGSGPFKKGHLLFPLLLHAWHIPPFPQIFPTPSLPPSVSQCFLHDPSHSSSLSPTPLLLASTFPWHTMQTCFHFSHWTEAARCTGDTSGRSGYDFWIPPFNLIIVSIGLRIYLSIMQEWYRKCNSILKLALARCFYYFNDI